ncbi:MAG TPA: CPBP family intramembrane glutamic endopeptidase [Candidatus Dormibacteraeota bacterium]|nr:CPBP family intramembrane glutamic endopeptidase [Candidatus Dormibacteraeota bacterium]
MTAVRWLRAQPLAQLLVYALILLPAGPLLNSGVKALMRAVGRGPLLAWDLVAYAIGDVLLVVVLLLGIRFLERVSLAQAGLPRRHAVRDLGLGFTGGALLMGTIIGVLALAGWYRGAGDPTAGVVAALALFFLAAVSEEIRYRAIAFRLAEGSLGTWAAIVANALLFGLGHLGNPHATALTTLAVALGGILGALLFVATRTLWPVIGMHWAWNVVEGSVFGVPVSGQPAIPSLLHGHLSGPAMWTGGKFGPEAGLVALILLAVLSAALLWLAVRLGHIVTPTWLERLARQQRSASEATP